MRHSIKALITQAGEVRLQIQCSSCSAEINGAAPLMLGPIARALLPQFANLEIQIPVVAVFLCEKCSSDLK